MRSKEAMGQMRVAKIEYAGKSNVFNLEVEDVHSFVVNGGIVSHNCYDETRYFLMANPLPDEEEETPQPKYYDPYRRNLD